jgi:hypothetical protein
VIENNEFGGGANFGFYLYKGGDLPFPGDDGHPKRNRFINNRVHHNVAEPLFLTTGDDNSFVGNIFEANGGALRFINGLRNRIESNSLPRDVVVNTQGAPDVPSTTIVRNQPAVSIQVDAYSTTVFEDSNGRIFDPEEPGIASTATAASSALTLTTAKIAKGSFVQLRNLQVTPDAGNARVTVTTWNVPGSLSKRWLTQASSATRRITYKVGDLTPNTKYQVIKNGLSTSYTADARGWITFQDTAVTTTVADFEVTL